MVKEYNFLLWRSDFELATKYASYFVKDLARVADRLGFTTTDLAGDDAMPTRIYAALDAQDPMLVVGMGHGCINVLTAQDYRDVLWVAPGCKHHSHADDNTALMANRILYSYSCYTATGLGPGVIRGGAAAFIGYKGPFCWVIGPAQDPAVDPYAPDFFHCANTVAITLLRGGSVKEAERAAKAEFDKAIKKWEASDDPRAPLCVTLLMQDRNYLVMYGREDVRTTPMVTLGLGWLALAIPFGIRLTITAIKKLRGG